jgi:hypothetical protein
MTQMSDHCPVWQKETAARLPIETQEEIQPPAGSCVPEGGVRLAYAWRLSVSAMIFSGIGLSGSAISRPAAGAALSME